MKVITIYHIDQGGGYVADRIEDFRSDLEIELQEYPGGEHGYTMEDIDSFLESLKGLEVGQIANLGDIWTFTCQEMSKDEFDSLPEWDGW